MTGRAGGRGGSGWVKIMEVSQVGVLKDHDEREVRLCPHIP